MGDDGEGWLDSDDELVQAACFTAVVGVPAAEVVRRFGADPATERSATFAESFNDLTGAARIVFDDVDGGVLVAENNGWLGADSALVESASRGGRAASVYWSVNADMSFLYAVDGVLVGGFDPLLVEHPWWGADPESIRERARDLPFGVERPQTASVLLVERLTGVRLDRAWIERPHRSVEVPGADVVTPLSLESYGSFIRQALRSWWRAFRGKR